MLPLDLVVRSQADFHAVREAFEARFYIRSLQTDVRVEMSIIEGLRDLWFTNNGSSAEGSPADNILRNMDATPTS